MRLVHKVTLLLVTATTLPLGTAGFALIARNQRALESAVRDTLDRTARHAAAVVAADIEGRARQLAQTAAMIQWDKLSRDETAGALALLQRQVKAADAELALVGAPPAPPDSWAAHAPVERARLEGAGAVVYSEPFVVGGQPVLAASTAVSGRVLSLALPLGGLGRALDEVRGSDALALTLLAADGHVLVGAAKPDATVVAEAVAGRDGHARRFADGRLLAAFAPVGGLGWSVIVAEPTERAFAGARALRTQTLWGTAFAALGALVVAVLFARGLTGAIERLSQAARAVGTGRLDTRVPADTGDDEVATLARTFNQMGEELLRSRHEIERWNHELEDRVAQRTAELKEAQAQLVQAQKLAALGQLGAGVAHEINNPLGGVIGHVQLLLADRTPESADYEALRHIEEGARRASQVVQNLLRFSVQRKEPVRTSVDLNKLARDTLSLTESLIRDKGVDLVFVLADPPPRARADAGQLAQVLLNLVSNARTAMPSGGRLTIRTRTQGNEVALAVEDTGKGIAAEVRERIFEPFFTTKDEWSNVGLGLSVSYRIVAEHGGRIEVDSEPGKGARFTVWLPT